MKNPPLTQSLPALLPNGQQIRYFAKLCPHCQAKVEARHMHGLARSVDARVVLAAHAQCPDCGHRFNVACVIDEQKRVSRLWIPSIFLLWWLSRVKPAVPPQPAAPAPARAAEIVPDAVSADVAGSYGGRPIPASIDFSGARYVFEKIDGGGGLQPDEVRYAGFVFKQAADTA